MATRIFANSFVSGEISPELYGRHDLKAYFNGAASLENFIVRRTGGIRKRPGTEELCVLDRLVAPDTDTVDDKFKVFPFYYDAANFGLLVVRISISTERLQYKFIKFESGARTIGTWANVSIPTGIVATTELDGLNCKQVGDTLFFTRVGYQSFTAKISTAVLTAEFELLDNSIDVAEPNPITATAKGFYKASETVDSDELIHGIWGVQKHYALYGIKNGIMSKPAMVSTISQTSETENGTTTPWTAGATVTIGGTLDFAKHDYYILAKKAGVNFGKISEIYPVETVANSRATLKDWDAVYRDTTAGFARSGGGFLGGNPEHQAFHKRTLSIMPTNLGIKTTEASTYYRAITPHYQIDFGAAGIKRLFLIGRTDLVKCEDLSVLKLAYANLAVKIYPVQYADSGAGGIIVGSRIDASFDANGVLAVDIGTHAGTKRMGFIIDVAKTAENSAWASDTLFIGGILITNKATGAGLVASSAVLSPPATLSGDPNYTQITCTPTVFGKLSGGYFTTAWHASDPMDIYGGAYWTNAWNYTKRSMTIPGDMNFHTTATKISSISWTTDENVKQLSTMTLHVGAKTIDWATGTAATESQRTVAATLYAVGTTNQIVASFNVNAGFIDKQTLKIEYPAGVSPQTTYWLVFAEPIWMRGLRATAINTTLEFVDDNVIPGEVTGHQEMLVVGDVNMDCDQFEVFEQRSLYASSHDMPFTLWFSAVGDLFNFYAKRPQADDDAFSVTIPARRASKIRHVLAGKELLLFTEDGVYLLDHEGGVGLSYRTVRMRRICNAAADSNVQPIQVDDKTIFVGEDGRTVYELKYDLMDDAIRPSDRSVLAYHMTEQSRIVKMAHQRFPDSVVWFLLDDGTLISMTYMPEHEVYAWSHHVVPSAGTGMKIVDIADVGSLKTGSGIETTSDVLLVYEGGTKTIVERMLPNACSDEIDLGDDSASRTDHVGGTNPASVTAKLITLRPESPEVNTQGVPKRVVDVCLRVRRAGKLSVKPYEPSLPAMSLDKTTTAANVLTLFSGDLKIMPRGYISGDGQLQIESADSRPCEILSAVFTMEFP